MTHPSIWGEMGGGKFIWGWGSRFVTIWRGIVKKIAVACHGATAYKSAVLRYMIVAGLRLWAKLLDAYSPPVAACYVLHTSSVLGHRLPTRTLRRARSAVLCQGWQS